jgi:hypothetical protein
MFQSAKTRSMPRKVASLGFQSVNAGIQIKPKKKRKIDKVEEARPSWDNTHSHRRSAQRSNSNNEQPSS